MMTYRPLLRFLAGISLIAVTSAASADTVVFEDDFDSGLGNWHFYNTSPVGTAWSNPSYSNPPMSGKVMFNTGGNDTQSRPLAQWDTVSLTEVGDYISVSFDVLVNSTTASAALQVALFNTSTDLSGNYIGSNLGYTPVSDADGVVVQQYYSTNADALQYRRLTDNATPLTLLNSQQPVSNIGNDTVNNVTITLTVVGTGLQIDYSAAGNTYSSFIDTSPSTYDFNTLQFFTSTSARIDNMLVTTNIPETKSSAMLLGLGIVALVLFRKQVRV